MRVYRHIPRVLLNANSEEWTIDTMEAWEIEELRLLGIVWKTLGKVVDGFHEMADRLFKWPQ